MGSLTLIAMASDLVYGLLPDHLLLAAVLVLMLLETVGAHERLASLLLRVALLAGCAVLWQQLATGYAAEPLPGEIRIDRFALLAKLIILGCGLLWSLVFPSGTYKAAFLAGSSLLGALVIMGVRSRAPGVNQELVTAYRTKRMLKLALSVAYGALMRTESRGAHFRQDHPRRNDADWLKRTLATWKSESDTLPTLAYEPLDVKRMAVKKFATARCCTSTPLGRPVEPEV